MPAPVIIVTGVSRGIGRAIAEELQRRGAAVVGAARNVGDVGAMPSLLAVAADVTQESGRQAIIEASLAKHGHIDALVNNAGSALRSAAVDTPLDDFRRILETNLLSAFALCRAVHPHLKASRGSVVNVSLVTGSRVLPVRVAYGTSKAALDHVTRSLAVEWGPDGIRVNAVLPEDEKEIAGILRDLCQERKRNQDQLGMLKAMASEPVRVPAADEVRAMVDNFAAVLQRGACSQLGDDQAIVRDVLQTLTGGRIDMCEQGERKEMQGWLQGRAVDIFFLGIRAPLRALLGLNQAHRRWGKEPNMLAGAISPCVVGCIWRSWRS